MDMTMDHYSCVQLTHLPDELLMMIFKKINNMQVLHSLIGVNRRLNRIICDPTFTYRITLLTFSSDNVAHPLPNTMLDRFCSQILPKIHHNVKYLRVESLSMERVLLAAKYPNLYGLSIFNVKEETIQRIFTGEKFNFNC